MKKYALIEERSLKSKLLSILTSALMVVTTVVPTLPINSVYAEDTSTDGVTIVNDEEEKVKLLVGINSDIAGDTVQETINNANSKYLLGIASQFGVFLENDFTDHSADVESRLAVGGSANLSTKISGIQHDFEIGNGDFHSKVQLETLLNNSQFAHAIVNGNKFVNNSVVSSQQYDGKLLSKTFVISNDINLLDVSTNHMMNGDKYDTKYFKKTDEPLINFSDEFLRLRSLSKRLSEQETKETSLKFSTAVKSVIGSEYQNNIVDYKDLDKNNYWNGNMAHFCYEGTSDNVKVVKFQVTKEEWDAISNQCALISYENIPEDADIIVNVAGKEIDVTPAYKYTYLNGVQISTGGSQSVSGSNNQNPNNNYIDCERILYNFYDATKLTISQNFAGNIFAPNADVSNDEVENKGHLSGALIAKSFTGALEFGYRPYQGTIELLNANSGYAVAVNKVETVNDGETTEYKGLEGATIGLFDNENTLLSSVVSTGSDDYLIVPTKVDYSGNTDYTNGQVLENEYSIQEVKAPSLYTKSDVETIVSVKETIDTVSVVDTKNVPTKVTTQITIGANQLETITTSFTYDDSAILVSKDVTIDDNTFTIAFNEHGAVTSIVLNSGANVSIEDYTKSKVFISEDRPYYYDATNFTITPVSNKVTIENTKVKYSITLAKVSQKGTALNGATFKLYKYDSATNEDSLLTDDEILVDENGTIDITKYVNSVGIYAIEEVTAPEGATKIDTRQYFELKEDGTVSVYSFPKSEVPTYTVSRMAWNNNNKPDIKVNTLTFYFEDGTSKTINDVNFDGDNWWYEFKLGELNGSTDVVGIEITVSGSDSGKLIVEDDTKDSKKVFTEDIPANSTVLLGNVEVPTSPQSESISVVKKDSTQNDYTINFQNVVEEKPVSVTISKQDIAGKELAGATLNIVSEKGFDMSNVTAKRNDTSVEINIAEDTISFVSGTEPTTIEGLTAGTYTLVETTAPNGYTIAEKITFTIDEDGGVTINGKDYQDVVMQDNKTSVSISKQDATQKTELSGATLTITAKDKNADFSSIENPNDILTIDDTNKTITLTSSEKPTVIEGLPIGEYILTEVSAPDGYTINEVSTEFTIKADGTVEGNTTIEDEVVTVNISKIDVTNDKELSGATLQVVSKDGKNLSGVTSTNNTIELSEDEHTITFTSKDTATELNRLPAGKYVLIETSQPDGYTINKVEVEFTVDENGKVTGETSIKDDVTTVTISKRDVAGRELSGATLTITNLDENKSLQNVTVLRGTETVDATISKNSVSFVTDGKDETIINKLPTGTYRLTETTAPDGYEKAEDIFFRIDENGTIFTGKTADEVKDTIDDKTIIMIDEETPEVTTTPVTTKETTATTTTTPVTTKETTATTTTTPVTTKETTATTTTPVTTKETTVTTTTTSATTKETTATTTTTPATTKETTATTTTTPVTTKETTATTTTTPVTTKETTATTTVPTETTIDSGSGSGNVSSGNINTGSDFGEDTETTKSTTTTVPTETTTATQTTTTVPTETTTVTQTTTTVPTETTTVTQTTTTVPTETTTVTQTTTTVPTETTTTTEATTTTPIETTTTTEATTTTPIETTTTTEATTTTPIETTTTTETTTIPVIESDVTTTTTTVVSTTTSDTTTKTSTTNTTNGTNMTTTSATTNKTSPSTSDSGFGIALSGLIVALSIMVSTTKEKKD